MDDYLTVKQLSAKLNLSRATIYRLMDQGLPSVSIGHARRFSWPAVEAWLEGRDGTSMGASQVAPPLLPPRDEILQPGFARCTACVVVNRVAQAAPRRVVQCGHCGRIGSLQAVALGEIS